MNRDEFTTKARTLDGGELITFAFEVYGKRIAIGTSLQKTGSVIIDLASKSGLDYSVFFVDTLFNYDETIEFYHDIQKHYGIEIERLAPDPEDIEKLYETFGQFPWFSEFGRARCCEIRKRFPLLKKLQELDGWISGLRSDQSDHRQKTAQKVSVVNMGGREVVKINPLFDWTQEQLEALSLIHI